MFRYKDTKKLVPYTTGLKTFMKKQSIIDKSMQFIGIYNQNPYRKWHALAAATLRMGKT